MDLRGKQTELNREDRRKALIDRISKRNVYVKCFNTEAGRSVLLDQIRTSYFFTSPFTNNGWTPFALGENNKLLQIASNIPGIFTEVMYQWGQEEEKRITEELEALKKEFDIKG